ncbi:MAG: Metallo-dependent phosphatase-like protein [Monoraphidium minutum]|nr:MAG: Metallo-dependent phosphatase-like protein [Monoraphidium minutum]
MSLIIALLLLVLASHACIGAAAVGAGAGAAAHNRAAPAARAGAPPAAQAVARALLVSISPDLPPISRPFDESLSLASPDISEDDPRVSKRAPGCQEAEQVHLTYWSPTSVLVSWATCDAAQGRQPSTTGVTRPDAPPAVTWGPAPAGGGGERGAAAAGGGARVARGVVTSYVSDYSAVGQPSYASPRLNHVLLEGLQPGRDYYYRIRGDGPGATWREFDFTAPKSAFPFTLGVLADPGQTYNTSVTLNAILAQAKPDIQLLLGDFCYADQWQGPGARISPELANRYTYQPKWDTWGRLFEPLLSRVPLLHTNGNHEVEQLPAGARGSAYNHRFPVPRRAPGGPSIFAPVTASSPYSNLYYSSEVPSVATLVFLTSYAPGQAFGPGEEQYDWLERELGRVDRGRTPWLVVVTHAPWYTSYAGHYKENECMRAAYEPLLVAHGVDVMLFGHIHSYERTKPIVNYEMDACGPVHLNVGDGGNAEGLYKDFIDTVSPKPAFCADPAAGDQFPPYQPQACLSYQRGAYCFARQPAWSALREPSFGHGALRLLNATHAEWRWTKNQGGGWRTADEVTIMRGAAAAQPARCAARRVVAAAPRPTAGRRAAVRVTAGWGDPVTFTPAKVVSSKKVADQLHSVMVDVGTEIAAGYTKGGQYVQVKVGDSKPGFFAIASPPDPNNQGVLEFLIKASGDTAEKLAALAAGASVEVSPVQGKGFPTEKLEGVEQVLIFATGSGISPIRAVIESEALAGAKDCRLYWGTRNAESTAYADRIPEWKALGVDVVQVFSEGEGGKYVQDAFAADKRLGDPSKVGVLLCGQKPMAEAVKEMMAAAGVDAGAILTNF